MNLKYRIMWFEDNGDFIKILQPSIEEYLQELGFIPNIMSRPTSAGSLDIVREHDPDLMLVDDNLAEGTKGEEIVDKIRDNELYVDVIFYAQKAGFRDRVRKLDGVFYTDRATLREKIPKIIDLTVRKQQDVSNMRGVIIAESIDLERKMECFITDYLGLSDDAMREPVFESLYDWNGGLTFMEKYELTNDIFRRVVGRITNDLNDASQKKEPADKVESIKKAKESMESKKAKFDEFNDDIIRIRNIMAHWEELRDEKNTLQYRDATGKRIIVNDAYCKDTRKRLREHSANLESLIGNVKEFMAVKPKAT